MSSCTSDTAPKRTTAKYSLRQEDRDTEPGPTDPTKNPDSQSKGPEMAKITSVALSEPVTEQGTLAEFPKFQDLPLEIRARIWSFAAPEPSLVVQCSSRIRDRSFHYARAIPAVLHAFRESRLEYLETDDPKDQSLQLRRAAHPVYKLHFQQDLPQNSGSDGPRASHAGWYMSTDFDTLCGRLYLQQESGLFVDIGEFGVAATLKHLAVTVHRVSSHLQDRIESLRTGFPVLETLTFMFSESMGGQSRDSETVIQKWAITENGDLSLGTMGIIDSAAVDLDANHGPLY
ncbi:uncharacterized protein LY89DRAFT_737489 [Mollisia scopiformis]|uniref:2EXR domain-containing protein n=1 Tax=Mollisia scopiformis TaxID=149040 RepID=A0A194WZZ2_MOLSC|nr:uncharacterized protein LY89DRAFT_737489 [Mollisia scopiformis]KUJ13510.1 hypothetical protein LY89DRAFT_737489 [Mollisia scopiformis]